MLLHAAQLLKVQKIFDKNRKKTYDIRRLSGVKTLPVFYFVDDPEQRVRIS